MRALLLIAVAGCGNVAQSGVDAEVGVDAEASADAAPLDAETCAASPAQLRARWRGDDTADDDTGAYDAILSEGVTYVEGRHGGGFRFDEGDEVVTADPTDQLWPAASFSLEAWVKTFSTYVAILEKYDCGGGACAGDYWVLWADASGVANFSIRVNGSPSSVIAALGTTPIDDGEWHHLVGVRDVGAGELRIFVDGALEGTTAIAGPDLGAMGNVDEASDPVTIGASILAGTGEIVYELTGVVDEAAYYETAVSADEVAAIHGARDGICAD